MNQNTTQTPCQKSGLQSCDYNDNKFKDIIENNGFYFTVYISSCAECGHINEDLTWVE
jgi:hypothetical protein